MPTLERLLEGRHEVVAVVSQPDRPRGRGRKTRPAPVAALALERGVPLLRPYVLECLGSGPGGSPPQSARGSDSGVASTGGQGLVGNWTWSNGVEVDFRPDGTGTVTDLADRCEFRLWTAYS